MHKQRDELSFNQQQILRSLDETKRLGRHTSGQANAVRSLIRRGLITADHVITSAGYLALARMKTWQR
jgi:hypothetical protein